MHVQEFQTLMHNLYFHRDCERGIARTYEWLKDEVRELGEALESGNKQSMKEEFADVIAWLASLANILDVDLENAALAKYDHKCPKCRHKPCTCTF